MPQANDFNLLAICASLLMGASPVVGQTDFQGPPTVGNPRPLLWEETYPLGLRLGQAFAASLTPGRILMFGGELGEGSGVSLIQPAGVTLGDLWEWNGSAWRAINAAGPGPRSGAAMAFNPATGRVMLFGGFGRVPEEVAPRRLLARTDTWEFDGNRWTQLQSQGPLHGNSTFGRADLFIAFDVARSIMVLLVGNGTQSTTWEWDGDEWNLKATSNFGWRYTQPAYDADTKRLVSRERQGQSGLTRTVEWTGDGWVPAVAADPDGFFTTGTVGDLSTGRAYTYASIPSSFRLWARQAGVWTLIETTAPAPGAGNSALSNRFFWDSSSGGLLTTGADSQETLTSHHTYVLQGHQWVKRSPVGPGPRLAPLVAHDNTRQVAVVSGAGLLPRPQTAIPSSVRRDTWEFDGQSWRLKATQASTFPVTNGPFHFDHGRGNVFATSLTSGPARWDWDGTDWSYRPTVNSPSRRSRESSVYHQAISRLVLFGGRPLGGEPINVSTWLLDDVTWTELAIPGPSLREAPLMSYDSQRERVVLFGGTVEGAVLPLVDTWEFDGASWVQMTVPGPPATLTESGARAGYRSMTYDPIRQRTVLLAEPVFGTLVGGQPSAPSTSPAVIWEWDGSEWRRRAPVQPVRPTGVVPPAPDFVGTADPLNFLATRFSLTPGFTSDGTLAFDPISGRVALWGGQNYALSSYFGPISVSPVQLRELSDNQAFAQPASIIGISGRAVCFEARIAIDDAAYRWFKDGTPIFDGPGVNGASTESLLLTSINSDDAGEYRLVATSAGGVTLQSSAGTLRVRRIADITDDGFVNTADLMKFLAAFGRQDYGCSTYPTYDLSSGCLEDLNADGTVDTRDLVRLLGQFGTAASN